MGVYCDFFFTSCYHINGEVKPVEQYIEPSHPEIVRKAKELGSPKAIYNWIITVPYKADEYYDKWETASEALQIAESGGALDCLGRSTLVTSMLIALGYDAWVTIVYLPKRGYYHAYVEFYCPEEETIKKLELTCYHCPYGEFPEEPMIDVTRFNHLGILGIYDAEE